MRSDSYTRITAVAARGLLTGGVERLEGFQAVAVRVAGIEASHAGELVVEADRVAGRCQPGGPFVEPPDQ
jgi:hypothetical protein